MPNNKGQTLDGEWPGEMDTCAATVGTSHKLQGRPGLEVQAKYWWLLLFISPSVAAVLLHRIGMWARHPPW